MTLPVHPLAELFPLIDGEEFSAFAEDIRLNGVVDKIVLLDGAILDGRNRFNVLTHLVESGEVLGSGWGHRAGEPLDAEHLDADNPWFCRFNREVDGDPLSWVLSKNLKRRHLNESQRAVVAAKLANMAVGRPRSFEPAPEHIPQICGISARAAAAMLNVGARSVESARTMLKDGTPDLQHAVEQGRIAVSTAETISRLPQQDQAEIIKNLPRDERGRLTAEAKKALAPVVKEMRAEKQAEKKERREQREADLGRKLMAKPEKKYGVAIEDFEWDHEPWSRDSGMDRHPSNHYPTASDAHAPEEIVARTAERFACLADDCVLYMWTTIPHEAIAHRVLELRGFKYVSQRAWFKQRPGAGRGPGYWVTGEHELLLIAVRGKVVPPSTAHFPSAFSAPVGGHSEKPDQQYEHAEFHFPSLPKIELNARRSRDGWDAWGYEAPAQQVTGDFPAAPRIGEPMEFSIGGLRKNVARFQIRHREDGRFDYNYNFQFTTSGSGGPFHGDFSSFEAALRAAILHAQRFLIARRDATDSVTSEAERRAARAGLEWIEQRCTEWGLALDLDSPAKADADLAATEGAQAPAAEGMDSAASRLADGRTSDPADGDVVAPSSSAGEFVVSREERRTVWKALAAIDAGVTIEGPILELLLSDRLIMTGAVDCGYILTSRGQGALDVLDAHFSRASDGGATTIPEPEQSGETAAVSARPASSPDLRAPADPDAVEVGCSQAPATFSKDTDAPGCTAASAGGAAPAPAASPEPEPLEIPAFLKRRPDNSLPPRDASEAA
jgi:N6-adenosine-specific RNA methylase IME4